jgi:hypothetical protein
MWKLSVHSPVWKHPKIKEEEIGGNQFFLLTEFRGTRHGWGLKRPQYFFWKKCYLLLALFLDMAK